MIIVQRSSMIISRESSKAVKKFIAISRAKNMSMKYRNIEYPKFFALISGKARSKGVTTAYISINNV